MPSLLDDIKQREHACRYGWGATIGHASAQVWTPDDYELASGRPPDGHAFLRDYESAEAALRAADEKARRGLEDD